MIRAHRNRGYTLVEVAAIVILIFAFVGLLVGILLPALGAKRRTAFGIQQNTQVRGIHQALVMYSQGNSGYYPGLDDRGNLIDATVEYRFQQLLDGNYFTGEYAISHAENKAAWTTGTVTSENYSYAMLDIDAGPGGRRNEWRDILNPNAVAISDRNTGNDATANVQSAHLDTPGEWRGQVAYNDNHVVFETTHVLPTGYTVFDQDGHSSILQHKTDNLFASDSPDDALMIHSGK